VAAESQALGDVNPEPSATLSGRSAPKTSVPGVRVGCTSVAASQTFFQFFSFSVQHRASSRSQRERPTASGPGPASSFDPETPNELR